MPINLLNLPHNEIANIGQFFDRKTTLLLREVNKQMKETIDEVAFKAKKMVIKRLDFDVQKDEIGTHVRFRFSSSWDCLISRMFFKSVLKKLRINNTIIFFIEIALRFILEEDEIKRVLDYVKPLFQNKKILKLHLNNNDPQSLHMLLAFLEGRCIPYVFIGIQTTEYIDLSPFLLIVNQLMPHHVDFSKMNQTLEEDSVTFLLKLADVVKSLWIFVEPRLTRSYPSIIPIIFPLLGQKCEVLELKYFCNNNLISSADAEMMIQCFHHSEKRVSLTSYTSEESIDVQIGLYKIKTVGRTMSIKHLQMD